MAQQAQDTLQEVSEYIENLEEDVQFTSIIIITEIRYKDKDKFTTRHWIDSERQSSHAVFLLDSVKFDLLTEIKKR